MTNDSKIPSDFGVAHIDEGLRKAAVTYQVDVMAGDETLASRTVAHK